MKQMMKSKNMEIQKTKRDLKAWRGLYGIWQSKKIENPVAWQRKIRNELERTLP